MPSLHQYSFVAFLVITLLHVHPSSAQSETDKLIDDICNQIARSPEVFQFCRDFFHQHLLNPQTDLKGLAKLTVTQTLLEGTNAQKAVRQAKSASKNTTVTDLLTICDEGYTLLVNEYVDAQFSFDKGDFRGVEFEESKCPRFVQDCQKNVDAILPDIKQENLKMQRIVDISLAAIRKLIG